MSFQDLQQAQIARDKLSSPSNVLKIIRSFVGFCITGAVGCAVHVHGFAKSCSCGRIDRWCFRASQQDFWVLTPEHSKQVLLLSHENVN